MLLGQFGLGALLGVGGPHDALPMGLVIGICGLGALAVNLALSPRLAGARAPAWSPGRTGGYRLAG